MTDLDLVLDQIGIPSAEYNTLPEPDKEKLWKTLEPYVTALRIKKRKTPLLFAELTPKQESFFSRIRPGIKNAVARGANRSGKTENGALAAAAWLAGKEYFRGSPMWKNVKDLPIPAGRPRTVWASGLDFEAGIRDVIWPKLQKYIPLEKDGFHWRENRKQIEYVDPQGLLHVLTCKSSESGREKYQGASVDLVWLDEEHPQDIYDECYQRTIDCGGIILVTLTPVTDAAKRTNVTWIYDLYERWLAGDAKSTFETFTIFDNPHLPKEEVEDAVRKWAGREEGKARLYGEFFHSMGLCFSEFDPSKHCTDRIVIQKDWLRVRAVDPHPAKPTACLWAAVDHYDNLYIYREYYEKGLASEHAQNIIQTSQMYNESIAFTLIDPHGSAQPSAETGKTIAQIYRENGLYTRPACGNVDYGISMVQEYLRSTKDINNPHPKLYLVGDLPKTRYQISRYRHAIFSGGDKRGLLKDKPLEIDDDLPDCLRYLCAQRLKAAKYFKRDNTIPKASYT